MMQPSPNDAARAAIRPVDRLLSEYGQSHRNGVNIAIHAVAVPVIVWCVLAFLAELPFPQPLKRVAPWLDWSVLGAGAAVLYYAALSVPLAIGMALFGAMCIAIIRLYEEAGSAPLWQPALALFAAAWVLQFVGHRIEGKKPSFFKDVQFLLIGPAWLMTFVFRAFGLKY